jgi:hypothetical protein
MSSQNRLKRLRRLVRPLPEDIAVPSAESRRPRCDGGRHTNLIGGGRSSFAFRVSPQAL